MGCVRPPLNDTNRLCPAPHGRACPPGDLGVLLGLLLLVELRPTPGLARTLRATAKGIELKTVIEARENLHITLTKVGTSWLWELPEKR